MPVKIYCDESQDAQDILKCASFVWFLIEFALSRIENENTIDVFTVFLLNTELFTASIDKREVQNCLDRMLKWYETEEDYEACMRVCSLRRQLLRKSE